MNHQVEKKLKTSRQRNLILCVIRSTHCHPTADWIFERARKDMPNISLGTIYRNLNLLRDEGKIQELRFGNSVSRYDGDLRSHYHVRCMECGEVVDVPHIVPLVSSQQVEELTGYRIHKHRLEFTGLCPDCLKRLDNIE
ncbi:transcriptional repressor [bacterium]|nr:transcriptional repressor [bacterium]